MTPERRREIEEEEEEEEEEALRHRLRNGQGRTRRKVGCFGALLIVVGFIGSHYVAAQRYASAGDVPFWPYIVLLVGMALVLLGFARRPFL